MTEKKFKEYVYQKADNVKTKEDLMQLLDEMLNCKEIDYGKIVYAISGCMLATANYIDRSPIGGITGFQASFIGWEMIRRFLITNEDAILRIINYTDMLYPQYEYKFEKTISKEIWEALQREARKHLIDSPDAHPGVIKHWESIANGKIPFGYKVEKDV